MSHVNLNLSHRPMHVTPPRRRTPSTPASASASASVTTSESPHDQVLQLWIEHGRTFNHQAAHLTSAWNANHLKAITDYAAVDDAHHVFNFSSSFPSSLSPSSFSRKQFLTSPRITINRNHATRSSVRALRQKRLSLILLLEQQEKEREHHEVQQRQQAEAARLKKIEEQRLRVEKQQAEQKKTEEQQQRRRQLMEQMQQVAEQQQRDKDRLEKRAAEKRAVEKHAAEEKAVAAQKAASKARNRNNDPKFDSKYNAWQTGPSLDWYDDPSQFPKGITDSTLTDISSCISIFETVTQHATAFRKDPSVKHVRLAAKRVITRAINQSSGTIEQVRIKVMEIITGIRQLDSDSGNNMAARAFGMHEFASQILLESNNSIAGNKELAYGLAAIVVGVTAGCPDPQTMKSVVLGALYSKSVVSRPHFPSRRKGEELTDFRKRLCYKSDDETEEDFIYRQRAYIHLLAAVFQTNIQMLRLQDVLGPNAASSFPISMAWTWVARVVNRRQRTLVPEFVHAFLETAGYAMSKAYGAQFAKLMSMVRKSVVSHASPYASALSMSNMDVMLTEFEENGHKFIEAAKGREMPLQDRKNT